MNPNQRIINQIFQTIDLDHNEYMEFDEFMDFLLMMRHGTIRDKAGFVFKLISQVEPRDSISFVELIVFYFKVIDEFGNSEDPDILVHEDFTEYVEGSMDEKELFLRDLDRNLVASISLADVFFNLMQVGLKGQIREEDFIEFMDMYPRTMDLFNFIDISDKDFRNVQSINKTNQYIEAVSRIIVDVEGMLGVGGKGPGVSHIKHSMTMNNMQFILEKVDKIQKDIEYSIEQSMHQGSPRHSLTGRRLARGVSQASVLKPARGRM